MYFFVIYMYKMQLSVNLLSNTIDHTHRIIWWNPIWPLISLTFKEIVLCSYLETRGMVLICTQINRCKTLIRSAKSTCTVDLFANDTTIWRLVAIDFCLRCYRAGVFLLKELYRQCLAHSVWWMLNTIGPIRELHSVYLYSLPRVHQFGDTKSLSTN